MRRALNVVVASLVAALLLPLAGSPARAEGETTCKLSFKMKGWSEFHKTSSGDGTIHCDNGQSMAVAIKLVGGGLTFGKTETRDGVGKFSPVGKIDELLGSYAQAEAEAGAVKSAQAEVLSKGNV